MPDHVLSNVAKHLPSKDTKSANLSFPRFHNTIGAEVRRKVDLNILDSKEVEKYQVNGYAGDFRELSYHSSECPHSKEKEKRHYHQKDAITKFLGECTGLRRLALCGQFSTNWLKDKPNLAYLKLASLGKLKESLSELLRLINQNCPRLEELVLGHVKFSKSHSSSDKISTQTHHYLKRLELRSHIHLSDSEFGLIASRAPNLAELYCGSSVPFPVKWLESLKNFTFLKLHNVHGEHSLLGLIQSIEKNCPKLEELDLTDVAFTPSEPDGSQHLRHGFPALRKLTIDYNRNLIHGRVLAISDRGFQLLTRHAPGLTELTFRGLDARDGQASSGHIAHLKNRLEKLTLNLLRRGNVTGDFPALRTLHLGNVMRVEVDQFTAPVLEEFKWNTHVGDDHRKLAKALERDEFLPRLKILEVIESREEHYLEVKKSRPNLQIITYPERTTRSTRPNSHATG